MTRRRLPGTLRTGEAERLLAAARSPRDRLLLGLGLWAGLRRAEIMGLRIEDIDLDAGDLTVTHGKGDRARALPIAPPLVAPLTAWIGRRRVGWLFPSPRGDGPLQPVLVNRLVRAACEASGIQRRVTAHTLRHHFATTLIRRGADIRSVQLLLGHSALSTTQVYLNLDLDDLRRAVSLLG